MRPGLLAICLAAAAAVAPHPARAQEPPAPPAQDRTAQAPASEAQPSQAIQSPAPEAQPPAPASQATQEPATESQTSQAGQAPAAGSQGPSSQDQASRDQASAPGSQELSSQGQAAPGSQPPPGQGQPPPGQGQPPAAAKEVDGVSAGMSAAKLLLVDVREVLRSPEHWHRKDWALFTAEVLAVVGLGVFDESLQRDVLRPKSAFADNLAKDFRTFGNYGSFEVLGGFYLGGLLAHDVKAQETTLDGLFASGIAGGLISPFLKLVVGRDRPNAHQGAYDFHPFSLKVSFPSGESTQAFAVASVISTQYPNPWVEFLSYTTAAITSWGRIRENGHWSSDVLAGAFIGYHVGRTVVHINNKLRARVRLAPMVSQDARGVVMKASF